MTRPLVWAWSVAVALTLVCTSPAAEFFVSRQGNDQHDGRAVATAFATLQRGLDALQPGDTLTLLPGEYFGAARRAGLGNDQVDTTIRAHIPGTVVLRGDTPAAAFAPVPGQPLIHVTAVAANVQVHAVNELDTLRVLEAMPNLHELAFAPGRFFHDAAAGKLYISTSDYQPADRHRYSLGVTPTHGLYLTGPRRVTVQGLIVTGFSAALEQPRAQGTMGATWGIFLNEAKNCVVRQCRVYLNGQGIGINSRLVRDASLGGNLVEHCIAWANGSPFTNGDTGGITLLEACRDEVRDSVAFRNRGLGINIYLGGIPSQDPQHRSRVVRSLAWGNDPADLKIKTGYDSAHATEDSVVERPTNDFGPVRSLFFRAGAHTLPPDSLALDQDPDLQPDQHFADPDHFDFRLQADSRLRGSGPDGIDRGPFPYADNVFFVSPQGDDQAQGTSVARAWRTLERATRALKPGATLYLLPGAYSDALTLQIAGKPGQPVIIRGRGTGEVRLNGQLQLQDSRHVVLERVQLRQSLQVNRSRDIALRHCRLSAEGSSLAVSGTDDLEVRHCEFTGFREAAVVLSRCTGVTLSGNRFDNAHGAALRVDTAASLRYAQYNGYQNAAKAWIVGDAPEQAQPASSPVGVDGWPVGPYDPRPPVRTMGLAIQPRLHSHSDTTANIEWHSTLPAVCQLAWGKTPQCEQTASLEVDHFGTFSLTGLEPGTTYYFRIRAMEVPKDLVNQISAEPVKLDDPPLVFTTARTRPSPRTCYVSPEGNDAHSGQSPQQAWRTIAHAAAQVNVGDTVLIAGGVYPERVRLRATGAPEAPITFAALPGQKVVLDGAGKQLNQGFIASAKSHLRFDGLYFVDFGYRPLQGWARRLSGELVFYAARDVRITRCFSDGRNGYTARFISAFDTADMLVQNCVTTNKMSGAMMWDRCPGLRMENSVIARPMIACFVLRNTSTESAVMTRNIFTDGLKKKADLNALLFAVDLDQNGLRMENNGFFLRSFGPDQRHLLDQQPTGPDSRIILDPLFANPRFAGDRGGKGDEMGGVDQMMRRDLPLDFPDFFSTDPQFMQRGIGLQPPAFADFHFHKPAPAP